MHAGSTFATLAPIIRGICDISGIPGVSLGILHNYEVIHTASFGYADVERQALCDCNTTFILGSLSKAMTAALISSLHEDGSIPSWDAPLRTLLPAFNRTDVYGETTIADLLSHRTGLASLDFLWLASDNVPFLPKSQAVQILNYAPGIQPFRSHFLYSNFAYEVLGQVIEKISGSPFAQVLRRRLSDPLGMKRTYYTGENDENEAKPYAALEAGGTVRIAPALQGADVLMGPAGGIRSSVNDLLTLYIAFMEAARREMTYAEERSSSPLQSQPLRAVRKLWQAQASLPSHSLREHSYAFGWARAQMPAVLAPGDHGPSELSPEIGVGAPSRLALYHGGFIPGFDTYTALFPETGSGVVVLTNSMSLNGGVRWIGELLVEALFGNSENGRDYIDLATRSAAANVDRRKRINESLAARRTVDKATRHLDAYVGHYVNAIGNFFIQVRHNAVGDRLQVAYMGRKADTFELVPYQEDSFYWALTYDNAARLARVNDQPAEYHILKFGSKTRGSDIDCLWWKHEIGLPDSGEIFDKTEAATFNGVGGEL